LFVVSGIILSSKQLFYIKKWHFSFKSKYHAEKWKWGLPLKDVLHLSTHYSFLQEYSLLFKGIYVLSSRQAATWTQYVPSRVIEFDQGLLQRASTIAPFDSNTECLILQCFGRLHFYRNERCMFWGNPQSVGILLLERSNALPWTKKCSLWMKGIVWNEDIASAKVTLYVSMNAS
jgi:hypothetical protein